MQCDALPQLAPLPHWSESSTSASAVGIIYTAVTVTLCGNDTGNYRLPPPPARQIALMLGVNSRGLETVLLTSRHSLKFDWRFRASTARRSVSCSGVLTTRTALHATALGVRMTAQQVWSLTEALAGHLAPLKEQILLVCMLVYAGNTVRCA